MGSYGAVDHCVTMILNMQWNNMLVNVVGSISDWMQVERQGWEAMACTCIVWLHQL